MNIRRFGRISLTESLLLPVQLLLGMWVNLFITIPNPVISNFFESGLGVVVIIHILNGITIVTLGIIITVFARGFKAAVPLRLSIFAMVSTFLAISSGIMFLFFGQIDAYSYTMAVGLAFSALLYAFVGRVALITAMNMKKAASGQST